MIETYHIEHICCDEGKQETQYRCVSDIYNKGFHQLCHLKAHEIIHTRDTQYKCDVCDKGFNKTGSFMTHKRIHTRDTQYKCDVCDKGFNKNGSLTTHKKYTQEKYHLLVSVVRN